MPQIAPRCIQWTVNVYQDIEAFYREFRGEKRIIGKSAEERDLFALFIGTHTRPVGIATYAMHAREWVTACLAMQHVRRGLVTGGVWVVPLVNPDGALLVQEGARAAKQGERLCALCGGDFSLWKANARGVDLNVNWDARWGTGVQNERFPSPANFIGPAPFSEPETRALRDFTLQVRPDFTLSYHTKGEVIYWHFHQPPLRKRRDRRLAEVLSRVTGYPPAEARGSAGGYKDWCVEKLKIPAFTVEAGRDDLSHPLGLCSLPDILQKNLDVLVTLTREF